MSHFNGTANVLVAFYFIFGRVFYFIISERLVGCEQKKHSNQAKVVIAELRALKFIVEEMNHSKLLIHKESTSDILFAFQRMLKNGNDFIDEGQTALHALDGRKSIGIQ